MEDPVCLWYLFDVCVRLTWCFDIVIQEDGRWWHACTACPCHLPPRSSQSILLEKEGLVPGGGVTFDILHAWQREDRALPKITTKSPYSTK